MSDLGNKEIMANNIKRLMKKAGKSRVQICDELGIKYTTFTDWVNGNRYPRIDKIELMANYFGVPKSELVEAPDTLPKGAVPYNPTRKVPLLGQIAAGLPLYAEQNIEGYVWTDRNHGAEYFALRVRGDSMNGARIYDGDIILVRRQNVVEDGEIAVILVNDDATIKRYHCNGSTVILSPQSTNPVHQPQIYSLKENRISILGKVVESRTEI